MDYALDYSVVIVVIAGRILIPLLIPWYPLPGVLAALALDAVDQTLFQSFTRFDLAGYQGYDKALDIYYLSIAYISTLRNWTNEFAFGVSRFLFYYRLLGVILFEQVGWRPLLFIFPNTFEYFFIWYESVRLLWDPRRLSNRAVIAAAALIWLVIKLPQEYWIHIARLDVTDVIKARLFGVGTDVSWAGLFAAAPLPVGAMALGILLALAAAVYVLWRLLRRNLPPPDHGPAWRGDAYRDTFTTDQLRRAKALWARRIFDSDLLEKTVLVAMLCVIFAQIMPGAERYGWGVALVVAIVVVTDTGLSHSLARLGVGWRSAYRQFLVMAVINFTLAAIITLVGSGFHTRFAWSYMAFFALLLTLIVTLFDRFQEVRLARFPRLSVR